MGSWRRQHHHQYRRQPSPRHQNRGEPGPRRLWVKATDPHRRSRWAACPRHQRGCTTRTTSVPAKASMGNNRTWPLAQEPRRQRPAARQPRQRQRQPKTSEQRLPHWRLPLPLAPPLPPPAAQHQQRSRSPRTRGVDTRGLCNNGCGRPAAMGYVACCRTCTQSSGRSHGPRCNAAFQQSSKESSKARPWRRTELYDS